MEQYLLRHLQREVERQCHFALIGPRGHRRVLCQRRRPQIFGTRSKTCSSPWAGSPVSFGPRRKTRPAGVRSFERASGSKMTPRFAHESSPGISSTSTNVWKTGTPHQSIIGSSTPTPNRWTCSHPPRRGDRFRGFDTENYAILFHGEPYPLQPVSDAVEDLLENVEQETQKPRLPSK